jgi:hypothetical protein
MLNNCKIFCLLNLQSFAILKEFKQDFDLTQFSRNSQNIFIKNSLAFPIYFLVYFLIRNFLDWIKNSPQFFMLFDLVSMLLCTRATIDTHFHWNKLRTKQKNDCLSLKGLAGFIIFSLILICLTTRTNKQKRFYIGWDSLCINFVPLFFSI